MSAKPAPDQAALLLRRYNRLREAALRALKMIEAMDKDCALRLPFPGYEDAVEALRKELK